MRDGLHIVSSLREIERDEYDSLHATSTASVFYAWSFLVAAELSPLLPYQAVRYLCLRREGKLTALMPAYLQLNVDPFGVITRTTGFEISADTPMLITHIMHATETCVVCAPDDLEAVAPVMLRAFADLARELGARYAALLNTLPGRLMELGVHEGYAAQAMWDRFRLPLIPGATIEQTVQAMPGYGRTEVKRQVRKFQASQATAEVKDVRDADLAGVAQLCYQTTARNGTPTYYPVDAMQRLLRGCADIVRVVEVRHQGRLCGTGVILPDREKVHLWAGGADYDLAPFSPYSLFFHTTIRYALDHGHAVVEAGRTNKAIKERMGFRPLGLHSLIKPLQGDRRV